VDTVDLDGVCFQGLGGQSARCDARAALCRAGLDTRRSDLRASRSTTLSWIQGPDSGARIVEFLGVIASRSRAQGPAVTVRSDIDEDFTGRWDVINP
jgi:hypothetical protein